MSADPAGGSVDGVGYACVGLVRWIESRVVLRREKTMPQLLLCQFLALVLVLVLLARLCGLGSVETSLGLALGLDIDEAFRKALPRFLPPSHASFPRVSHHTHTTFVHTNTSRTSPRRWIRTQPSRPGSHGPFEAQYSVAGHHEVR